MRSLRKIRFSTVLILLIISLTTTTVKPAVAESISPSVAWNTPNSGNIEGTFTISAYATPVATDTSSIKKWCLTRDGAIVTTNIATLNVSSSRVGYYGTFDNSTGCWSSSTMNLNNGIFTFDSTSWSLGNHTFIITITDTTNRTTTSTTLTLNVQHGSPSVAWNTPNSGNIEGTFTISAYATPVATDTSSIKKWCLTRDGAIVTTNIATLNVSSSRVGYYGTFDNSTGCWSSSTMNLNNGIFTFDSTSWSLGNHTFIITITDTTNRTTTSTTLTLSKIATPASASGTSTSPGIAWSTPNDNNVRGTFTISANSAQATTAPAVVSKWCLTKDGNAITTNVVSNGVLSDLIYATFNSDTGCWTRSAGITTGSMIFDSTTWADGSHTFVLTVTDSSTRTATSSTLTVNNTNTAPTVTWATTNNTTQSGVFTISAVSSAAPSGTAVVSKWCLTKDGNAITTNVVSKGVLSDLIYATFNSDTGCWTRSAGITSGSMIFDSTAWTNGLRKYVLTVTDSSGRTSSTELLNITTSNPQPTVKVTVGIEPSTEVGAWGAEVEAEKVFCLIVCEPKVLNVTRTIATITMYHPGASGIDSVCFKIDSAQCTNGKKINSKDSITTYGLAADTRMWNNGKYTISSTITDTENRTLIGDPSILEVSNSAATATTPKVRATTPKWNQKTVSVSFSAQFDYATRATVFWGINPKKLQSRQFSIVNWTRSSIKISSLKPNTVYYFKTTALGPNGSRTSKIIKLKTPKIPAKPRPTYSGGSGGGSGSSGGVINVVGMRLDKALDALGWSRNQASDYYCQRLFGILNLDNWYVKYQTSSMLYACKK